jgi:hypothetical protein
LETPIDVKDVLQTQLTEFMNECPASHLKKKEERSEKRQVGVDVRPLYDGIGTFAFALK